MARGRTWERCGGGCRLYRCCGLRPYSVSKRQGWVQTDDGAIQQVGSGKNRGSVNQERGRLRAGGRSVCPCWIGPIAVWSVWSRHTCVVANVPDAGAGVVA